jgi:dTDP-4-dehydrorhamnose 3,5-epimerase
MARFDIQASPLEGHVLLWRKPMLDERGLFERLFCEAELAPFLKGTRIVQVNRSLTKQAGTVRGIHFQRPPHAEVKFVNCVRGSIFDVAVDLRRGSKTFLKWHGATLSAQSVSTSVIPEGFGHAFQALEDDCELIYLHTAAHEPAASVSIGPLDPAVGINWPREVAKYIETNKDRLVDAAAFEGLSL